jgi:hypothetical protein
MTDVAWPLQCAAQSDCGSEPWKGVVQSDIASACGVRGPQLAGRPGDLMSI